MRQIGKHQRSGNLGRERSAGPKLRRLARQRSTLEFLSYRDYLRYLYDSVKGSRGSYSYAQFALDLGFSHSNVLWLVITGRRALSSNGLQKIVKSLVLRGKESKFLGLLLQYNNAKRPDQREKAFLAIIEMSGRQLDDRDGQNTLEYFSKWYHPIIREMVALPTFRSDPEWIAAQLCIKVPPRAIKQSLKLLETLNLIRFDPEKERHVQTSGHIRPDRRVGKVAAIQFHQTMCDMARESVTRVRAERRELNSITLRLSEETAMKLGEKLNRLCDEIVAMEDEQDSDEADQIYQVNLQVFPFTKPE